MPNGPSPNARPNLISLYAFLPGQDADAGAIGDDSAYTTLIAADVRCGVHLVGASETYDSADRPTTTNAWKISLRENYTLNIKDKGVFTLDGLVHEVFVQGFINRSGRSGAYEVICTERVPYWVAPTPTPPSLLLETGGFLLLETGDKLIF